MIRLLSILLIISFSFGLKAQRIIYKPVFIDQCTDSVAKDFYWYIADCDSTIYNLDNLSSNGVYLPKIGKYLLYLDFGEDPEELEIKSNGTRIDTFFTERVKLARYVSNPPYSEFYDCAKLANGKITDYYYKGNIRLTGTFKAGQPVDTLKRFYRSGVMQELFIPTKRKRQQIFFYKNGNIKTDYNFAKNSSQEYYESGKIKKVEKWRRRHTEKVEYYKSGNIKLQENKKSQTRYYSNGIIQIQTTRKEVMILERIFTKYGSPWYEYKCNLFDSSGNMVAFFQYGGSNFSYGYYFPENISEIEDYQFEKIAFYKNGDKIQSFDFFKLDDEREEYRAIQLLLKIEKENSLN